MNSTQIHHILNSILGSRLFRGVFPSDGIPPPNGNTFPYAIVVNTDKQGQPGRHWQALWINCPSEAEFFDSFGQSPKGSIANYLSENEIKITQHNTSRLQANYEISCGPFVIYYVIQRARGLKMKEIISCLSRNKFIDAYVKLFASSLL